jgi:formiminotetrahydrofolate cyclodeaminase
MPTLQQQEALYQEGRIELAINAHKQDKSMSFRTITSAYDVPQSTAQDRAKGIQSDAILPQMDII